MLKKIFCFGLGLAGLLVEKFDELACEGEKRLAARENGSATLESEQVVGTDLATSVNSAQQVNASTEVDDLTVINGIGPTFARRLKEAGINTYQDLAALSADQLRAITQAADWQANPDDWILQARAIA